ncbi:CTP:phosphocholine cytidylyltransferase involved in choline phosphorylation for cell surface LPS epitopes [Listeria grayi]|nr:CTP:phosphocholine cytidylyltransferase involved in choline phosphorylation for cell surface LPS epitopes [Listeria grayi]
MAMKDYFFGREYEISSAGGETGQAFMVSNEDEKFFLKRNSSPFLAALSVENIVPKLMWTRRVENGDVLTAQKWINCYILSEADMQEARVAKLLAKIHHSEPLKNMLARIDQRFYNASSILDEIKEKSDFYPEQPLFNRSLAYLEENIGAVEDDKLVVCHGDVNHKNWIVSEEDDLYLVDWDEAKLADPAIDIGVLLYQYIPREKWDEWLHVYGTNYSKQLHLKLKWYTTAGLLHRLMQVASSDTLHEAKKLLQKVMEDNEV